MPWLLSSRGYGVLLDNNEMSYHRVGSESPDAWSMEVEATEMRFRVFAGPTPAEALERFTASLGRQPHDYAPWFFGSWLQSDYDDRIDEMREADGVTGTAFHNRYVTDYHCGVFEATADAGIPLARFVRSGWTGT